MNFSHLCFDIKGTFFYYPEFASGLLNILSTCISSSPGKLSDTLKSVKDEELYHYKVYKFPSTMSLDYDLRQCEIVYQKPNNKNYYKSIDGVEQHRSGCDQKSFMPDLLVYFSSNRH